MFPTPKETDPLPSNGTFSHKVILSRRITSMKMHQRREIAKVKTDVE